MNSCAFLQGSLKCGFLLALVATILTALPAAWGQQSPQAFHQEMRWRLIGPFRGGRTRAVAGVPSQPNVFYIGVCNGGVWKTDDYGRTWNPIFDDEPVGSVGAIAVAASDPNIIYVGSGEGLQRPDLSVGNGMYKSTDGGKTWTHLGLDDGEQIPQIAVDPRDANHVFAAVLGHPYGPNEMRGIFRSVDGGQTWQKVLYVDENTGGSDVEIDPANPDIIYAGLWAGRQGPWEDGNAYNGTTSGLFKSTDGGNHWTQLKQGLPEGLVQVNVAIAPSNTSRLYATVAMARGVGIFRSDDAGASWTRITTDTRPAGRIGGGDLPVPRVDPKNPDIVYATSTVTWKSTDGGKTWTGFRGAPGGDDYQNIWINPNDPDIILLASDQGAIVTVNGGKTWGSWYNQPTAQLYHVSTSNEFPYQVCSGQQESGSVCISSRGNDGAITFREWHPAAVIEYGYAAPDPLNPNIVYGGGRNDVTRYHRDTGQAEKISPIVSRSDKYRFDRTEPTLFSPVDPHVLYYAANYLFKTSDGGRNWQTISPDLTRTHDGVPESLGQMARNDANADKIRGVIYSLAPSFKDINTLWAGTDDGWIWLTRDGGKNWKNITPPELTPWSKVTQIAPSHFDENTAYASVSRFRIDDLNPYIYRTQDGGKTWTKITTGLPENAAVDTVREDPVRQGLLFAGTENAVWVSFDEGDHWKSLQLNLPHTAMRDLWIHDHDLIVGTHGRSIWILDDITPLEQWSPEIASADAHLFKPESAYRVRRDTNTDTPLPPDEPAGKNPPDGAILDYSLSGAAAGPVTLEIFDAAGNLARRYSSDDKPEFTEAELYKTLEVPVYWVRMPKILSAEQGTHRFVWDLHYSPPKALRYEYPISAVYQDTPRDPRGPRAAPGIYTVKLTANGKTYTQTLEVKKDPRVHATPAEFEQQFALEKKLTDAMNRDGEALEEVSKFREDLKQRIAQATGGDADRLKKLDEEAAGIGGAASPAAFFGPAGGAENLLRLNFELGGLYGLVDSADVAPTQEQTAAEVKLDQELDSLIGRWNQLKAEK